MLDAGRSRLHQATSSAATAGPPTSSSLDIRNGRLTAHQAAELIAEHDGKRPASLDVFLEHVGLSEDEFMEIVARHTVNPWQQPDRASVERGPTLWDQGLWDRTLVDPETPPDLVDLLEATAPNS